MPVDRLKISLTHLGTVNIQTKTARHREWGWICFTISWNTTQHTKTHIKTTTHHCHLLGGSQKSAPNHVFRSRLYMNVISTISPLMCMISTLNFRTLGSVRWASRWWLWSAHGSVWAVHWSFPPSVGTRHRTAKKAYRTTSGCKTTCLEIARSGGAAPSQAKQEEPWHIGHRPNSATLVLSELAFGEESWATNYCWILLILLMMTHSQLFLQYHPSLAAS